MSNGFFFSPKRDSTVLCYCNTCRYLKRCASSKACKTCKVVPNLHVWGDISYTNWKPRTWWQKIWDRLDGR